MPRIPVGNTFLDCNSKPTLFDELSPVGRRHDIKPREGTAEPQLYYSHPNGELWVGDCIAWLSRSTLFPGPHFRRPALQHREGRTGIRLNRTTHISSGHCDGLPWLRAP